MVEVSRNTVPHLGLVLYSVKDLDIAKKVVTEGSRVLKEQLRRALSTLFPSIETRGELSLKDYLEKAGLLPFYKNSIEDFEEKITNTYGGLGALKVKIFLHRFIIGLGDEGIFETGITLHPIYGIPYVPGSSIKGALRATLPILLPTIDENSVFGPPKGGERAGSVDFTDGLIVNVEDAKIYLEVITRHVTPADEEVDDRRVLNELEPPTPVTFIAVKDAEVIFYVLGTGRENSQRDLNLLYHAFNSLKDETIEMTRGSFSRFPIISIGAKTSSGFGRVSILDVSML